MLNVKNNATSTITEDLTSTETDVTVNDASQFPSSTPFRITINDEIMEVTGISSNTFTVTRGVESTTATTHSSGDTVELRVTAGIIEEIHTEMINTSGTPVDNDFAKFTDSNTVEGRSYSELLSDLSLDSNLQNLASGEVTQLENINSVTVTNTQWGYLGSMSAQPLEDIVGESITDLSEVNTATATAGNVLRADGTDFESTQLNHTDLTTISSDDHHTKYALTDDLASGEITQIQNINSVTITNTQWGYLGSMSAQPLEVVDSISEIDASIKTGADSSLVTGTAGTSGNLAEWNTDGDAVDSGHDAQTTATKTVSLKPIAEDASLSTGDNKMKWVVPASIGGMDLVDADAHVFTASSSGTVDVQIHNATDSVDMLSTKITIDATEKDSSTAATQPVIDTANDDVAEADEIRIDVDAVGTGSAGLEVRLSFR